MGHANRKNTDRKVIHKHQSQPAVSPNDVYDPKKRLAELNRYSKTTRIEGNTDIGNIDYHQNRQIINNSVSQHPISMASGDMDFSMYNSLDTKISTLNDNNSLAHTSIRKELENNIKDCKNDIDKKIDQIDKRTNKVLTFISIILASVAIIATFILNYMNSNIIGQIRDNKEEIKSNAKEINKNKEYLMKIENTSENHAINKNSTN